MRKLLLCWVAVFVSTISAHAAFILTLSQVGNNVVVNGGGTLNTTALTLGNTNTALASPGIVPSAANIIAGAPGATFATYSGITGPANFGTGTGAGADTGTGSLVSVVGSVGYIRVPTGYVSGATLSDTATFNNATLATLGFTPGTYTYTWGAGTANADSFVVTSDVPEPSTWTLLGLGAVTGGLMAVRRRQLFA